MHSEKRGTARFCCNCGTLSFFGDQRCRECGDDTSIVSYDYWHEYETKRLVSIKTAEQIYSLPSGR